MEDAPRPVMYPARGAISAISSDHRPERRRLSCLGLEGLATDQQLEAVLTASLSTETLAAKLVRLP